MMWRIAIGLFLVVLGMGLSFRQSQAHGLGEQRLERVEAGPFRISAWTDPITATTDKDLHVTVAVEDEEGLVLNADITIICAMDARTFRDTATHEKAVNKLQYEGRFRLSEGGTWRIEINVVDDERTGTATFELPVEDVSSSTLPFSIGWIVAGGVVLIVSALAVVNRRNLAREKKDVS